MRYPRVTQELPLFLGLVLVAITAGPRRAWAADTGEPISDKSGFVSIFNGKDLAGWDGDPRLWSVRHGIIVGETTVEKPAPHNTFLIWRGGKPRDFVLKLKFHIHSGNSGVQYRSQDLGDWIVSGYQGEVANDRPDPGIGTGFLYHERGRGDIARIGEFVVIDPEGHRTVVGQVADMFALKAAGYYKNDDWNEYTIMAYGNHLIHLVNGYQTIEMIDNDTKGGAREGILALQIHAGEPMLVEFKDIRLKTLDANVGPEGRKYNDPGRVGWITAPAKPAQK
jgi:hypothetical protein